MIQVKMKYPGILLLVLFSVSLTAQQPGQKALQDQYQELVHPSDLLLNGREYKYYFSTQFSTPLIPKDLSPSASVLIHKQLVQNVILMYDTYKDLVIYYDPNNLYNDKLSTVVVNSHIIEEFTLQLPSGKARFKYLTFPEDRGGALNSGFYELISDEACKFIINHSAVKSIKDGGVVYLYKTERYIINAGTVYKIKGKNSLLKALSNQHTEVHKYLKREKIHVGSADKEQIKAVLDYYTSLKHL
jgi:hypothetical protein